MKIYIDSLHNKIVKEINSLKNKKDRDKKGLFLLEGERLINEAVNSVDIKYVVVAESYNKSIDAEKVYCVSDPLFDKMADTVNPQGIMAVCSVEDRDIDGIVWNEAPFFVVLENVTDPGNMGTIIRTADAAGADGIFVTKGCVDIYNPKVIRATMGSVFHLPVYRNVNGCDVVKMLNKKGVITLGAHLKGDMTPYDVDMTKGTAVIIGNEANGLSDEISKEASHLVKIPMPGKAESMNAGVAAGILIYEAVRQRRQQYGKNKLG